MVLRDIRDKSSKTRLERRMNYTRTHGVTKTFVYSYNRNIFYSAEPKREREKKFLCSSVFANGDTERV